MVGIVQGKKNLYIIGASGLGREMESWLELIPEVDRNWKLIGYLDIDKDSLDEYPSDYKVISSELEHIFHENDSVLIAIADPSIKSIVFNLIERKNIDIMTYIAPSAIIGKFCTIGKGSIICPNAILTTNVVIGTCVFINCGTQIGHDVVIGDFSTINANVDIAGKCQLGSSVFMGSNSMIIPNRRISDNAVIGAGSIVIKNIKYSQTVFGNPALKVNK